MKYLEEGKDYITKNSYSILSGWHKRADNNVVNMMAEKLNEQIKKYKLEKTFYVIGEDLISALKNNKQIKDDYIGKKNIKYIFVFDSNYDIEHTVLFVINNVDKTIDLYDTQNHIKDQNADKKIAKDYEILKKFYDLDYRMRNLSNKVAKQRDNDSCAFYCGLIIQTFIENGKYQLNNSLKNISLNDVHYFKKRNLRDKILKDVNHIILDNIPKETIEVYEKMKQLNRSVGKHNI